MLSKLHANVSTWENMGAHGKCEHMVHLAFTWLDLLREKGEKMQSDGTWR